MLDTPLLSVFLVALLSVSILSSFSSSEGSTGTLTTVTVFSLYVFVVGLAADSGDTPTCFLLVGLWFGVLVGPFGNPDLPPPSSLRLFYLTLLTRLAAPFSITSYQ